MRSPKARVPAIDSAVPRRTKPTAHSATVKMVVEVPKGGSVIDPSYLAVRHNDSLRTAVIVDRINMGMPDWRGNIPGRAMTPQDVPILVA